MESETESTIFADFARSLEPWVWPAIAAVLVGGAILVGTIIGLFWLAARPMRQPIVIWIPPSAEQAVEQNHDAAHANLVLENRP
jgi:hypothetical protein